MTRALILALALLAGPVLGYAHGVAFAQDRATTKDAERMVHDAVAFIKKNGKEKAIATFNDPTGPFTFRDLYIMVYDLNGKCLAHGAKPERVGKNTLYDKDSDGKAFIKERMEIAKSKGKGWQDYKWMNPVTKQVEQKVAYLELVDGLVVTCGAYKP